MVIIPLSRQGRIGAGTLLAFLFAAAAFGCAAANIHDVIWCGRVTNFYMNRHPAGSDLDLWVNLLRTGTTDYRIFGFYMFLQVVVALATAHVILRRLSSMGLLAVRRGFFLLLYSGVAGMAFAITMLDWPRTFENHLYNALTVSAGFLAAIFFFYVVGSRVSFGPGAGIDNSTG